MAPKWRLLGTTNWLYFQLLDRNSASSYSAYEKFEFSTGPEDLNYDFTEESSAQEAGEVPAQNAPQRQAAAPDAALITIPQSSPITGFSVCSSYDKARAGKLPGAFVLDGRWYVHKGKLLAWLDSLGAESAA